MITKRNFSPLKVLGYIWREVLFTLIWSSLIWGLYRGGYEALSINFTPIGILGSALAIFVAFRNNSAYGRWWERIKNTPLPRQYDFFTRLFVWTFAILLPLGLLSLFSDGHSWIIVPLATIIAAVFTIMEKTGAANENPFENSITDVPLTALCRTIERDLREMLGEQGLPRALEPVGGYLF